TGGALDTDPLPGVDHLTGGQGAGGGQVQIPGHDTAAVVDGHRVPTPTRPPRSRYRPTTGRDYLPTRGLGHQVGPSVQAPLTVDGVKPFPELRRLGVGIFEGWAPLPCCRQHSLTGKRAVLFGYGRGGYRGDDHRSRHR